MKILNRTVEIAKALFPKDFSDKRCFHLSLLFDKNKLLCVAENSAKTHSKNRLNVKEYDVSKKGCCSELRMARAATRKFDKLNWRKLNIVNIRLDRSGKICNSRPCKSCQNLLFGFLGAKSVYFTNDKGNFEKY